MMSAELVCQESGEIAHEGVCVCVWMDCRKVQGGNRQAIRLVSGGENIQPCEECQCMENIK